MPSKFFLTIILYTFLTTLSYTTESVEAQVENRLGGEPIRVLDASLCARSRTVRGMPEELRRRVSFEPSSTNVDVMALSTTSSVTSEQTDIGVSQKSVEIALRHSPIPTIFVNQPDDDLEEPTIDFANNAAETLFGRVNEDMKCRSISTIITDSSMFSATLRSERIQRNSHSSTKPQCIGKLLSLTGIMEQPLDYCLKKLYKGLYAVYFSPVNIGELYNTACNKDVIEQLAIGVLTAEPDGKIISVNQKIARMYRTSQDNLVGRNISIFCPPDIATTHIHNGYLEAYWRKIKQGNPHSTIVSKVRRLPSVDMTGERFEVLLEVHTFCGKLYATMVDCREWTSTEEYNRVIKRGAFPHIMFAKYFHSGDLNQVVSLSNAPLITIDRVDSTAKTLEFGSEATFADMNRLLNNIVKIGEDDYQMSNLKGTGDGVMMVCDPIIREVEAPVFATYFALSSLFWVKENFDTDNFSMRISIALGTVQIGILGTELDIKNWDGIGEAANKSARLCQSGVAGPMSLIIDQQLHDKLKGSPEHEMLLSTFNQHTIQAKGITGGLVVHVLNLNALDAIQIEELKSKVETVQNISRNAYASFLEKNEALKRRGGVCA